MPVNNPIEDSVSDLMKKFGEEEIEFRPEDIEKFAIIQVMKSALLSPEQLQMSVGVFEGILGKDITDDNFTSKWKTFKTSLDSKYGTDDELRGNPMLGWKIIELSNYKFSLLMTLWREKRPKSFKGKVS